ncbi:MAG TPA: GNAT family N-acetyltransferase [Allosphingosinicella sp.]|nr:GNAT family N-acetyltransferase [Allosphingosinicella sp.]
MFARTERLLLRPGWKEDAPALFQAICDERIVCNLANAPWPYSFADAEAFLEREPNGPLDARWLITLRTEAAPRLIGCIGFGRTPTDGHEFGYWIARPFWGQGFATEAGRAVIDIARRGLRLRRLNAGHFIDNPASGRVLKKLGFRPTGTALRYSKGRSAETPCRLFELDLQAGEDIIADPARAMAA